MIRPSWLLITVCAWESEGGSWELPTRNREGEAQPCVCVCVCVMASRQTICRRGRVEPAGCAASATTSSHLTYPRRPNSQLIYTLANILAAALAEQGGLGGRPENAAARPGLSFRLRAITVPVRGPG